MSPPAWKTPAPSSPSPGSQRPAASTSTASLVLRTVSNYDQQRTGITAAESLAETKIRTYSAFLPAVNAAYLVGDTVVRELVTHWPQYRDTPPYR